VKHELIHLDFESALCSCGKQFRVKGFSVNAGKDNLLDQFLVHEKQARK
jgi:hypothetical protein